MFQSTPPRGGATKHRDFVFVINSFNPRPHARGDFLTMQKILDAVAFQSTPPREGRQKVAGNDADYTRVSIHAPTRGATNILLKELVENRSFNPRPHARGDKTITERLPNIISFNPRPHARGDSRPPILSLFSWRFNPRPHARGDLGDSRELQDMIHVSIHAPTRGATWIGFAMQLHHQGFNPRPHARGDRNA